jgi:hypothetical protein
MEYPSVAKDNPTGPPGEGALRLFNPNTLKKVRPL